MLDMDRFDTPTCPIHGMFVATNDYFPNWGNDGNIGYDYGRVVVRPSGACEIIADRVLGVYDFCVACKAHDYCYDLRTSLHQSHVGKYLVARGVSTMGVTSPSNRVVGRTDGDFGGLCQLGDGVRLVCAGLLLALLLSSCDGSSTQVATQSPLTAPEQFDNGEGILPAATEFGDSYNREQLVDVPVSEDPNTAENQAPMVSEPLVSLESWRAEVAATIANPNKPQTAIGGLCWAIHELSVAAAMASVDIPQGFMDEFDLDPAQVVELERAFSVDLGATLRSVGESEARRRAQSGDLPPALRSVADRLFAGVDDLTAVEREEDAGGRSHVEQADAVAALLVNALDVRDVSTDEQAVAADLLSGDADDGCAVR